VNNISLRYRDKVINLYFVGVEMIEPPDELEIGALSMGEEDHQQVSEERRNRFLELIDDDFWLDELWEVFFPK
jgi:hypothetical protein